MKSKFFLMMMGLVLALCSYSFAQVPQMMNYQGKLTNASGAPVNDTLQVVFTIYADEAGTTPLWTETQPTVEILKGVFNVLLGSVNPISDSIFDGSVRYLGVKVGGDPEITPRKAMVSVPYAMKAGSGGGEMNCHDCDTVFVNVIGPDSVVATSGTAFLGKASGGNASDMYGVKGYGDNTSTGTAYGGYFSTSSSGTGHHYGVRAEAYGASSNPTYGSYSQGINSSTGEAYGCFGSASTYSSGDAYGGRFVATGSGEGWYHVGVSGQASGSTNYIYGVRGYAFSDGGASLNGGYFETGSTGTGPHTGVEGRGYGSSSSNVRAVYGWAMNEGTGPVYGGYFFAHPAGTGEKYGVYASAPADQGYAGYFQGDVLITDSLVAAGAVKLPVDAIYNAEILDEPGCASNKEGVSSVTLDGTLQTLLSRTITCPASGYLLVIGTCQPIITHTNGTTSNADFGVSATSASLPNNQDVALLLHSGNPTGSYDFPVTVHGLFSASAGANTFYLLAREWSGVFDVYDMQLTLVYLPTAYGTVIPTLIKGEENIPDESAPKRSSLSPADEATERAESEAFNAARIEKELAEIRAQVKALEEELNKQQQKQENQR